MINDLPITIGNASQPQGTISIDASSNLTFQPVTGPPQPPPGSTWHLDFHGNSGPLGSSPLSPPMVVGVQKFIRISGNFTDQAHGTGHLQTGPTEDDEPWVAGGTPIQSPKKY